MHLSNRKISREDYNIFIEGLHHVFGTTYGIVEEHIGKALRHYGQHLLSDEIDHLNVIDKKNRPNTRQSITSPIFEPAKDNDEDDNNM